MSTHKAVFDMMHELIHTNQLLMDPPPRTSGMERRSEERLPYRFVQLLAPFDGENLPTQADFRHVYCHNISSRGFSFFESPYPNYKKVVALFGKIPFRAFTAEVRHVQKTSSPDIYLVGCRFTARLSHNS